MSLSHCVVIVCLALAAGAASAADQRAVDGTQLLFIDRDNNDLSKVLPTLVGKDRDNALLIARFPIAVWFTGGTPTQVRDEVAKVVAQAGAREQLPVLVPYNLPFRDCQQYSAGGAKDARAYKAWIDAFAAGIGRHRAIVILEPDSLGIVPHYTTLSGQKEWCQPKVLDVASAPNERFEQLNHAVDTLSRLSNVRVYLDGTHSQWLSVGEVTHRLLRAGVLRTAGFYLNVSNYYPTDELIRYGVNVSQCIHETAALTAAARVEPIEKCENSRAADTPFDGRLHFVIDTSRNGRGAWTPSPGKYADPQAWCNPPARGLGDRPTLFTSHPLLDAKLWIKVPGESDGECTRGSNGRRDPERGMIDPPAGKWFKEQAAELIELAVPALTK